MVLPYKDNPFYVFFQRGLNVTLCTDKPLQLHVTDDPISEEYAIAAQMWKLSNTDLCEIARNSVLISGFDSSTNCGSRVENDPAKTNVPNLRIAFRQETRRDELDFLQHVVRSRDLHARWLTRHF